MAGGRPVNSGGSPVLAGSFVQARPAVLWVVRWFPSLITRLLMLRSMLLAALSSPVTSIVFAVAVVLQVGFVVSWGLRLAGIAVGVLAAAAGAIGVVPLVVLLIAGVFAWKLWLAAEHPDFDLDPWIAVSAACLVVVPVLVSWVGVAVVVAAGVEKVLGVVSPWVRVWQQSWQFRRKWPIVWATITGNTAKPQASHGGGTGLFGSTKRDTPRELLNHPALGLFPDYSVRGSVAWRVFRPNGQLVKRIEELSDTICEQFPAVIRVEVEQETSGSSFGVMRVWFVEPPSVLDGVEDGGFDVPPAGSVLGDSEFVGVTGSGDPVVRHVDFGGGGTAAFAGPVVLGASGDLDGVEFGVVFDPSTGEVLRAAQN